MLIFFNPPQSFLQVQLLDPDGIAAERKLEEQIAAQILQARQGKVAKRKRKKLSLKESIQAQLDSGIAPDELLAQNKQALSSAEIQKIVAEHQAALAAEVHARIQKENTKLELLALQQQEKERQQRKKKQIIQMLLLIASIDDHE